jgi:hypothetical protein
VPVEYWGAFGLKSWKGGKYRDLAGVKEAFCTKNSQLPWELSR